MEEGGVLSEGGGELRAGRRGAGEGGGSGGVDVYSLRTGDEGDCRREGEEELFRVEGV